MSKNDKIYMRRCHKCDKLYKTSFKFSKCCSDCDNSNNSVRRNKCKVMIK